MIKNNKRNKRRAEDRDEFDVILSVLDETNVIRTSLTHTKEKCKSNKMAQELEH